MAVEQSVAKPAEAASLWDIFYVFFILGLTSWGGLYVVLSQFERETERRGWLTRSELQEVIATATVAPGPTFYTFAGIIGYLLRGWTGAAVAMAGIVLPASLMVLGIMYFIPSDVLTGPLAPVTGSLSVVVAGVLIGTGIRFVLREGLSSLGGLVLFAAGTAAVIQGVSIMGVVIVGLLAGAFLTRNTGSRRA